MQTTKYTPHIPGLLEAHPGIKLRYDRATSAQRRIHDPNQVESITELVVGKQYRSMHIQPNGEPKCTDVLEIISVAPGIKMFTVRVVGEDNEQKAYSAADKGIVPYDDGRWHQNNYLVPLK